MPVTSRPDNTEPLLSVTVTVKWKEEATAPTAILAKSLLRAHLGYIAKQAATPAWLLVRYKVPKLWSMGHLG